MGVSQFEALNRIVSAATVQVTKDGQPQGLMSSEKRQHVDSFRRPTFEPSTEVGIRSNLQEDVYITFAGLGRRNRRGGVPLHHQSAGVVGLVRRLRAGARRTGDDVARRGRGDLGAAARRRTRSTLAEAGALTE